MKFWRAKNSFLASSYSGRTGWLIWSFSFIWLNKTNKMNQTNQIRLSASGLLLAGISLRG